MSYLEELQQMEDERKQMEDERKLEGARQKCRGACFCTGRCMYTPKEWDELQKIKDQYRFTGVNEMLNKVGD